MIALFHLNYWCNSEEEKKELEELFKDNEEKYQIEIRKKYNPDDIFKKKKELPIKKIEESSIAILPKEKWYKKLLNIIKNLFKKN